MTLPIGTPIYVIDVRGDRYEGTVVARPAGVTTRPAFPQVWVELTKGPLAPAAPLPWPIEDVHRLEDRSSDA